MASRWLAGGSDMDKDDLKFTSCGLSRVRAVVTSVQHARIDCYLTQSMKLAVLCSVRLDLQQGSHTGGVDGRRLRHKSLVESVALFPDSHQITRGRVKKLVLGLNVERTLQLLSA